MCFTHNIHNETGKFIGILIELAFAEKILCFMRIGFIKFYAIKMYRARLFKKNILISNLLLLFLTII